MASETGSEALCQAKFAKHIFKCDVCRKPCNTLKSYLKHSRLHTSVELTKVWSRCAICKQFFPTDFDRQSHGLKDHCEVLKTIKCWYCPIESSSNKEFFNHAHILHKEKVQKEWTKCSKCADYRPSKISLNVHFKSAHKDISDNDFQPIVLERKVKQIKCKYCPVILNSSEEYREHLGVSHSETKPGPSLTITPISPQVSKIQKTSGFECEFCLHFQVFPNKRAYLEHVKLSHMPEAKLRWTQCKNCQIYHPKNWEIDHGCTAKVQKTFDGKTCLVCEAKFESAEQCYSHMDKLHPNHDHFGQMCEICNGKRPDKTSLMLHKLTHLTSNESSGPKIKIITASEVQVTKELSSTKTSSSSFNPDELNYFVCGICGKKANGTLHNHFQHAKACIQMKRHSVICLYCPQTILPSLSAFKNHCEFDHMATMQNAPCIWCGATFAQLELLRFHYHKCLKKMALSEANWTLCGFCPTIFFFTELTKSAFFIGHMNNYHRQNVDFSWGSQCQRCKSLFPTVEASEHHASLCYKNAPLIKLHLRDIDFLIHQQNNQEKVLPKAAFIISREISGCTVRTVSDGPDRIKPIRAAPNSGLVTQERLTYQHCGICSKAVSGRSRDHFLHARACYMMKQNSPNCLLCPNESFPSKGFYLMHMHSKHNIEVDAMLCISCGISTSIFEYLPRHQIKCFQPLNETAEHTCELCHAKFYFEKNINNPFYIAHINSHHKTEIPENWKECSICSLNVPSIKLHQEKNCIQKLLNKNSSTVSLTAVTNNQDLLLSESKKRATPTILVTPVISDKKKRLKIEESEKNALRCGLCEAKIPGGPDLLYSHSRICLMKKISTIVCPCCPQRFFETKNSYAKHLGTIQKESHKPLSHATKCVFCGHNLPTWCDLLKHQGSCFPTLNLKSFNQCSYCDMGFFFAQLENVFYFAHMNKDHSDKVLDKWIEKCNNCNFRFPNEVFLKKHLTVCIQKQADNAGDKTSRSSKVTNEPKELFIEGDIKDEPLDISENIDAVTGEFITGDI